SVNILDDTTVASIIDAGLVKTSAHDPADPSFTFTPPAISVTAKDSFFQVTATGGAAFTKGQQQDSKSIAGALSVNVLTVKTLALVFKTNLTGATDITISATRSGDLI